MPKFVSLSGPADQRTSGLFPRSSHPFEKKTLEHHLLTVDRKVTDNKRLRSLHLSLMVRRGSDGPGDTLLVRTPWFILFTASV